MKKTVATGLMTGLGALARAAVIGGATTKADSYGSCSGDDYSINCSSDYYYWRRWQLPQPNRFLKRWLVLQQRLGRLVETRHQSVRRSLTLLVAVLALTLSGCALAPLATLAKPSPPAVVKQGTPVTVRGMTVNVTDMYGTNSIGNGFLAEEKHGSWLVLKLHVRNDGTQSQDFDAPSQHLIDVTGGRVDGDHIDGRSYSSDMFASGDLGRTSVLLNPGLEGDVVVAYDVPSWTTTPDHAAKIQEAFVLEVEVGFMRPPAYIVLTGDCSSCAPGNTK
jgi:hypothetical protein